MNHLQAAPPGAAPDDEQTSYNGLSYPAMLGASSHDMTLAAPALANGQMLSDDPSASFGDQTFHSNPLPQSLLTDGSNLFQPAFPLPDAAHINGTSEHGFDAAHPSIVNGLLPLSTQSDNATMSLPRHPFPHPASLPPAHFGINPEQALLGMRQDPALQASRPDEGFLLRPTVTHMPPAPLPTPLSNDSSIDLPDSHEGSQSSRLQPPNVGGSAAGSTRRAKFRRSRSGCLVCRKRKVKCDQDGNPCKQCRIGQRDCHYEEALPKRKRRTQSNEEADVPCDDTPTKNVPKGKPARRRQSTTAASSAKAREKAGAPCCSTAPDSSRSFADLRSAASLGMHRPSMASSMSGSDFYDLERLRDAGLFLAQPSDIEDWSDTEYLRELGKARRLSDDAEESSAAQSSIDEDASLAHGAASDSRDSLSQMTTASSVPSRSSAGHNKAFPSISSAQHTSKTAPPTSLPDLLSQGPFDALGGVDAMAGMTEANDATALSMPFGQPPFDLHGWPKPEPSGRTPQGVAQEPTPGFNGDVGLPSFDFGDFGPRPH